MRRQVNFLEMGQRLKLVRKSLNLQQKEMAVELGIPASYLSEIESGKGNPGPEFFNKLACEYNISMDYLVLGPFLLGKEVQKEWEETTDWRLEYQLD